MNEPTEAARQACAAPEDNSEAVRLSARARSLAGEAARRLCGMSLSEALAELAYDMAEAARNPGGPQAEWLGARFGGEGEEDAA